MGWVRKAEWGRNDGRWTAVLAGSIVPDGLLEFAQIMCTSCYAKFHWRLRTVVDGPPLCSDNKPKIDKIMEIDSFPNIKIFTISNGNLLDYM